MVRFDLRPLLQGQTRIVKPKSAYNSFIISLEVWDGKPAYRKSRAGNRLVWSDLTLGRPLQGQTRISAYNLLIIGPRGLICYTNL